MVKIVTFRDSKCSINSIDQHHPPSQNARLENNARNATTERQETNTVGI